MKHQNILVLLNEASYSEFITKSGIQKFCNATGNLWFNSRDETTDFNNRIANNNAFKSLMYKAKLLRDEQMSIDFF